MKILRTTGASLAIIGLLAGCVDDGNGGIANPISDLALVSGAGQSAEQRALANIQRDYARVRLTSAVAGVGTALIYCQIQGCSNEERNQRLAAGAVLGYLAGGYLTNRDANFRGTQETLQKDIQLAREDNAALERSIAAAKSVVAFQRNRIAELNRGLSQGNVTVAAYRSEIANMQSDVRAVQNLRAAATEKVASMNNSLNNHRGLNTGGLRAQRDAQQSRINRLAAEEQRMLANIASAPAEVRAS